MNPRILRRLCPFVLEVIWRLGGSARRLERAFAGPLGAELFHAVM